MKLRYEILKIQFEYDVLSGEIQPNVSKPLIEYIRHSGISKTDSQLISKFQKELWVGKERILSILSDGFWVEKISLNNTTNRIIRFYLVTTMDGILIEPNQWVNSKWDRETTSSIALSQLEVLVLENLVRWLRDHQLEKLGMSNL